MNKNTILARIKSEFNKQMPDKTIIYIIDYDEKGIYVIHAVPTDKANKDNKWMDGMYSMDKDSFEIVGGYVPPVDGLEIFDLPKERTIYQYRG